MCIVAMELKKAFLFSKIKSAANERSKQINHESITFSELRRAQAHLFFKNTIEMS